jgi:predicted nucleic acid-binding protein
MILIVDANIIISALIRESKSRELLTISPFTLYSPDTLLDSIEKYKDEFTEKSGLSTEDFETLLNFILEKVTIVKKEEYKSKLEQADEIMSHIDVEDVNYIALALSRENDGIWSDDAHFQKQDKIKVYKTEDIVKLVKEEDDEEQKSK